VIKLYDLSEKLALHRPTYNDCIVISTTKEESDRCPVVQKAYIYPGRIVPKYMVRGGKVYKICYLNPMWFINGFIVYVENDKVYEVSVFGRHTNADPETNVFCLRDDMKNVTFNLEYFYSLVEALEIFSLDSCHCQPNKEDVVYKELPSLRLTTETLRRLECKIRAWIQYLKKSFKR